MKLMLLDTDRALCDAWRIAFSGVDSVSIHHGTFESMIGSYDCLVSPANSFGLMDGGMDAAIIQFFGAQLEMRVQAEIWRQYRGEQPVGTCLVVPTSHPQCPWLAHCPTMRVPVDVSRTTNAYAACLAALVGAEAAGIQTLGCPGLATLTGQMPPDVAAQQMRYAYDVFQAPFVQPTWRTAVERVRRSLGAKS